MNELDMQALENYLRSASRAFQNEFESLYLKAINGSFINSNSFDSKERLLYSFVEKNYMLVNNYFRLIGVEIIKETEDGYCYFTSSKEDADDVSQSYNSYIKILDYLPFLLSADINISSVKNYEVKISDLEQKLDINIELKDFITNTKKTHREYIDQIFKDLESAGYVQKSDVKASKYLVLNSMKHIIKLANYIKIEDEVN